MWIEITGALIALIVLTALGARWVGSGAYRPGMLTEMAKED